MLAPKCVRNVELNLDKDTQCKILLFVDLLRQAAVRTTMRLAAFLF